MDSRRGLRRAGALLLGLLLVALASCGDEPVRSEPSIGQVEREGSIDALGMALVTNGEGVARFVGTVLNNADEPDQLVGVDVVTSIGAYDVVIADAPVVLPPGEPVRLARDARMTLVTEELRPGFRADVRFLFRNSAPIVTTLPVERQEGPYAEVEVVRPPDGDISPDG